MIAPKKSLGQNFLQDENILRKIVASLHLAAHDTVVEIGPGQGALTKHLLESGAHVVAVELDPRAVAVLEEKFGRRLELVHGDFLSVNLDSLHPKATKLRVVGNIPYYITSDILFRLFDQGGTILDATLMLQLEVAQRLTAKRRTKEYGILSVFTDFFTSPELLFRVSRNSFYPRPTVDSAVVHLVFKDRLPDTNLRLFKNVVRSTFGKRRKTLRNGLRFAGFPDRQLDALSFDLSKRPEELTTDDFLALTKQLEPFAALVDLKF